MDRAAIGIPDSIGKLACLEVARADGAGEGRLCAQAMGERLEGTDDPYRELQILAHQANCFSQIGVIRDHHRCLVAAQVPIVHQVDSQVHVRALLFCGPHHYRAVLSRAWLMNRHPLDVGQEGAFDALESWILGQGPEVGFLTPGLVGVSGAAGNARREVLDGDHAALGEEEVCQGAKINPAIRCALQAAVVQVEAVDVDDGARVVLGHGLEKSRGRTPRRVLRPRALPAKG